MTDPTIDDLVFSELCITPDDVNVVIYHGDNCTDGYGSAFSAHYYLSKKFPDRKVEYYAATFKQPPPDVTGKNVVICDFSYKKPVLLEMIRTANKIAILDHHLSAMTDLQDIENQHKIFRMDHSGAYLTWRFFHFDKPVPKLIQYIQDTDIWTKKLPFTNEFSCYMHTLPRSFENFEKVLDEEFIKTVVLPAGTDMLKQNNDYVESSLLNVSTKFMEINNKFYFVAHINSSTLKSEIGSKILGVLKNCNFSAIYHFDDITNTTKFSFRSNESKTNVCMIATLLGGGGHRNASACDVPYNTSIIPGHVHDQDKLYSLLETIYLDKYLGLKIAYLNTCTEQIGQYLLQTHFDDKKENNQELTRIMRNKHNNLDNYDCDLVCVWYYDDHNNKTCITVIHNKDIDFIKNNCDMLESVFSKNQNFEYKENKFSFCMDGCITLL
jgi:oligoribonuclease NrnB/cAMP/cGMP phosphodiesterase (DHH superfamily)